MILMMNNSRALVKQWKWRYRMDNMKKKLLDEFVAMSQGKKSDEILPLILAVSQKARQLGISFSKDETLDLINQLKNNLSDKEKAQIDMLINMMF